MEHARLAWEYAMKEVEMHQQRLVQQFVVFLTLGLTALASVALEKVPPAQGLAFTVAMFGIAGHARYQIALLPRRLRKALHTGQGVMETLMMEQGG